jgi:polysaccharide pyruvyl transferase WcaK-like protein
MVNHLRKFSLILARETRTLTYLKNLGLENLALVADPAFLLKPEPLPGFSVPANTVGVNLSPLTSWRGTDGDLEKWCIVCAKFVEKLQARFNNILLIPHVASPQPFNDDPTFLAQVYSALSCKKGVTLLEQFPSAGSLKWIISQCELFIGARTHATIAALSTGVPTLSLAYSQKAWGLNQDIFGHTDYCYDVSELEAEERVDRAVTLFCKQRDAIREILVKTIPLHKERASSAGTLLRQSLNK